MPNEWSRLVGLGFLFSVVVGLVVWLMTKTMTPAVFLIPLFFSMLAVGWLWRLLWEPDLPPTEEEKKARAWQLWRDQGAPQQIHGADGNWKTAEKELDEEYARRRSFVRCLAITPIVLGVVLIWGTCFLLTFFQRNGESELEIKLISPEKNVGVAIKEASTRLNLLAATMIVAFVAILVIVVSFATILRRTTEWKVLALDWRVGERLVPFALPISISLISWLPWYLRYWSGPKNPEELLFLQAMKNSGISPILDHLMWVQDLVFQLAELSLACATTLTICSRSPIAVDQLVRKVEWLKTVLYLSAALFVADVLAASALPHWVTSMLPAGDPHVENLNYYGLVKSLFAASYHLLFLGGIYIPALLVLRERASLLARRNNPWAIQKQLDEWLSERGLAVSPSDQFKYVAAILSPIVAAILPKIVTAITG